MRLSTQIITGHALLVVALVALAVLGIALLERMTRTSELVLRERLPVSGATRGMQVILLRHEIEKREPTRVGHDSRTAFDALVSRATGAVAPGEEQELLERIGPASAAFFEGSGSMDIVLDLVSDLVQTSEAAVRTAVEHSARMGKSGVGLTAVVAVIGLVLTLYFGYWLSKGITQPLERLARGLDAVTAGDLNRRFADQGSTSAIAEIVASLNQLTDRLQRSESTPRSDLLLACAALERLLEADERPCGVLAGGNRLVASNEEARKLVLARGSPFHGLAAEARERDASAVETLPLEGPGGQSLGDLVRIGRGSRLDTQ